jgi:SAM-dependent methyltransferase
MFREPFAFDPAAVAWGAAETNPPWWVEDKQAQAEAVCRLLLAHNFGHTRVACDISGGAGYAVAALAARFETVIYADLSVRGLNYAISSLSRRGVGNVAFVRADLLQSPFAGSATNVVCLDTLEYGRAQMEEGLAAIRTTLESRGLAVVDFHNWWRNPVRRLGLLPANFPAGGSVSRREAEQMLISHWLTPVAYEGWRGASVRGSVLRRILAKTLAPVRHIFVVRRGCEGPGPMRQGMA